MTEGTNTATPDLGEIRRALAALLAPGQVTELRALDVSTPTYRKPHTVSGYLDDHEALAKAAASLADARGVYIVPNDINPALLARAYNRLRDMGAHDPSTSDKDVARRCWLQMAYADTIYAQSMGSLTLTQADFHQRRISQCHSRYLSAIRALALVRRLLRPTVAQVNIAEKQVNIANA